MKNWFKSVFGWFSSTSGKFVLQAAVMKFIEAAGTRSRVVRAAKVVQLVLDIRGALASPGFTVQALQALIYDKLTEGSDKPSDKLLAMGISDAVIGALKARIPTVGLIPPEALASVETALAIVEQAARVYEQ